MVDVGTGGAETVAAWPAVCTGLAVHQRWAVVGLSAPLGTELAGLPAFATSTGHACDGLALVSLETGRVEGRVDLQGRSEGVASVAILEASAWPVVAVPRGTTARRMVTVGPSIPL